MSTVPSVVARRERRLEDVHRVRDLLVAADEQPGRARASSASLDARVAAPPASRRRARARRCGSSSAASCALANVLGLEVARPRRRAGVAQRGRRRRPRSGRRRSRPSTRPRQVSSVPVPSAVTSPIAGDGDARFIAQPAPCAQLARAGHELAVDLDLAGQRSPRSSRALLQRHRDLHLVAGLHEVAEADRAAAREPPASRRSPARAASGASVPRVPRISTPGMHLEPREVAVEDRERVRHVADRARALAGLELDDPVERQPVAAEHQPSSCVAATRHAVRAAERERVDQHGVDLGLARLVGHVVEVAVRVGLLEVDRRRRRRRRCIARSAGEQFSAPAAQVRCPVIDFGEQIASLCAWSPKTCLIAIVSRLSLPGRARAVRDDVVDVRRVPGPASLDRGRPSRASRRRRRAAGRSCGRRSARAVAGDLAVDAARRAPARTRGPRGSASTAPSPSTNPERSLVERPRGALRLVVVVLGERARAGRSRSRRTRWSARRSRRRASASRRPPGSRRKASPIACADAVQAVQTLEHRALGIGRAARSLAAATFWSRSRTSDGRLRAGARGRRTRLIVCDMSTSSCRSARPTLPPIATPDLVRLVGAGVEARRPRAPPARPRRRSPPPRERCAQVAGPAGAARSKSLTMPGDLHREGLGVEGRDRARRRCARPSATASVASASLPTGVTAPSPGDRDAGAHASSARVSIFCRRSRVVERRRASRRRSART